MKLSKTQKGVIAFSALWTIVSILISASLSDSEYSGFSKVTFISFSLIATAPIWLYWTGVWIWGFGYLSRLFSGVPSSDFNRLEQGEINFASLWSRAWAGTLDQLPALIIALIFGAASIVMALSDPNAPVPFFIAALTSTTGKAIATIIVIIYALYLMIADATKWQGAIGKRIVKIYVVNRYTGQRIGYIRSVIRFFVLTLSLSFYVGILGFLIAAFRKDRLTLHDAVCSTYVLKGRPELPVPPPVMRPARYRWLTDPLMFGLWLVTPLYLSWKIWEFAPNGTMMEIGFALGCGLLPLTAAVDARGIGTGRRIGRVIFAIVITALTQLSYNQNSLSEAYEVDAFKAEMANATPENYLDLLKSAHSKMGKAAYQGRMIVDDARQQDAQVIQDIDCSEKICDDLLKVTGKDPSKLQQLITFIIVKRNYAVAASGKVESLISEATNRLSNMDASPSFKTGMINSFTAGNDKVVPYQTAMFKSYQDFYNALLKNYDFLQTDASDYSVSDDGKLMFSSQAELDLYNSNQAAIQAAAQNVLDNRNKLVAAEKQAQNDQMMSLQKSGLVH